MTIFETDHISEWKSKGLSDEIIKPPTASDDSPQKIYMW